VNLLATDNGERNGAIEQVERHAGVHDERDNFAGGRVNGEREHGCVGVLLGIVEI
jgi:hypothetical protein